MMKTLGISSGGFSLVIFLGLFLVTTPHLTLAQANPCSGRNPCAAKNPCAANPCSANPCAANPCAPSGRAAGPSAKAVMVRGEVTRIDPNSGRLLLKTAGKQIDLNLSKHAVVREGPKVKKISQVKPGNRAMVSYVESRKNRTAWYVYLVSAASVGNPCAANPCAAKNPCAPRNPCAANPCSANPCAAKNPCAPKNPCGVR